MIPDSLFFALFNWNELEQRQASRRTSGPYSHPETSYLKAFLIKICEEKRYIIHCAPSSSSIPGSCWKWASIACLIRPGPTTLMSSTSCPALAGYVRIRGSSILSICKHFFRPQCTPCNPKSTAWVRSWPLTSNICMTGCAKTTRASESKSVTTLTSN